jgi:hypothetical protein
MWATDRIERIAMLSRETLELYRRMTLSDKLRLTLQLTREATPYLLVGTPEQVGRKFELLRRENDLRNKNMLAGIARTRRDP